MKISNKRVLVTGADGFIGSHLVEMLVAGGATVKALSFYNFRNHWGWLENINCLDQVEVVCGDIRDPEYVRNISRDIDIVFHLAALIGIPFSYTAPTSYLQTNVTGTSNILQSALENGVERVIHTSTSEVYGTAQYVPMDEKHPLQPQSPYSASKIAADAIAQSFHNSFNLPLTIVRPFNTYGPRQSARAVIPSIIIQILSGNPEISLGNAHPTRDFNYIEDTCRGFTLLAECDNAIGKTVNLGSNTEISISDIVSLVAEIMNVPVSVKIDKQRLRPETSEVMRLVCDNSKIRELVNYAPQVTLKEGLRKTIEWFSQEENRSLYKADIFNV